MGLRSQYKLILDVSLWGNMQRKNKNVVTINFEETLLCIKSHINTQYNFIKFINNY